ncbi:2-hydroxyacid dehydrogenase [Terracidiphilus sp.]|jgi:phosphoglycerate dehydrogenase-like enzyme|uniref:2-hydroxyacid dehydrogenase n=1 Tax=Terracidiphilus sp. TaxID=1964191 RepID=UPI003C15A498
MMRVGYPARIDASLLTVMPTGAEMVPLEAGLDHDVDLDVWIPDALTPRAKEIWQRLRGVKLVLSLMAGTEWIPETVGPRVTICNARGAHNIATAEWTMAAIFASLKYVPLYCDIQASGNWKRRKEAAELYARLHPDEGAIYPPVMQEELAGRKVLMVGYGSIGKDIERMLQPFDVELTRVARTARTAPMVHPVSELGGLLPDADIVILILPLTPESHGLMGAREMSRMKQGALLVNAARGPVVQTDALVEALNSGRIRAAIDVTAPEPLPEAHPLWKCPNLYITPHIGGSSPRFMQRALKVVAAELERYIQGKPLENVVQAGIQDAASMGA